jgi:SAM-dependent methyltransferase
MNIVDNRIVQFVHPILKTPLHLINEELIDPASRERFPIVRDIPRFCARENYAESFGFQWNKFSQTQLDVFSGTEQSYHRFYGETDWSPEELTNSSVLEVGSGAGRFTEVFLRTTSGILHSVDYSKAVDANRENNLQYGGRLRLAQASIYQLPFPDNCFDKVFCLGVLQHTPSFEDSVSAIVSKVKSGGEIVVDFYQKKSWYTRIHAKYIFRPLTKRISNGLLLSIIRLNIGWMMFLFDLLCMLRLGVLSRFIPIVDLRTLPSSLSKAQRREWAIMDTFDAFSPAYDSPRSVKQVSKMFSDLGCNVKFAGIAKYPGGESAVVRAVKR